MPNRNSNADILLRLLLEDKFSGEMDKTLAHFEEKLRKASSLKEVESIERQFKDFKDEINATTQALNNQSSVLRANAALLSSQVSQLRNRSALVAKLSGTVGQVSAVGLATGTAITGGIFAEVNRYVNNAKEATAATRAWKAELDSLSRSRSRIDDVLAREALPMLRTVARLAGEAATFVESHPQIVQAALNTGVIVAGLSAVGILVSKGIKLVADVLYLASVPIQLQAAKLQAQAAKNQLAAAVLKNGGGTGGVTQKIASVAPAAGIAGFVAFNVAASVGIAKLLDNLDKVVVNKFGPIAANISKIIEVVLMPLFPTIRPIRDIQRQIPKVAEFVKNLLGIGDAAEDVSQKMKNTVGQLRGSENEASVVSAFTKWKEDVAQLTREAAEQRAKIVADAEKQVVAETRKYADQQKSINEQANSARANIIKNFANNSKEAESNYARQRSDIVRDAGEDIQKIEQQHKDNLRKLTLEHADRVEELTAARDALGLVKEQRQFDRERSEAERETNQEIAQRRRDTAIRLQELAVEFAAERAQRQAEFQQQMAENEAQRQAQLKEAATAHQAEMQQIRANKAAQLRELQEGLNAERKRRREVFIAEIRDLDASLLGERGLKNKYYSLMLQDAEKFFASYRAKFGVTTALSGVSGSAGGIPKRDGGGYVNRGLYRMAWNGAREFVMSNSTTRAAEQAIGGQLSQAALIRGLGRGGQVTWNDHRRFDSRLSVADRRAIMDDTKQVIMQELFQ